MKYQIKFLRNDVTSALVITIFVPEVVIPANQQIVSPFNVSTVILPAPSIVLPSKY